MPTITVKEKPIPTQIRARRGALTQVSLNRAKFADQWLPGYRRAIQQVEDDYVRRVAAAMRYGLPFPDDATTRFAKDYHVTKRRWTLRITQDGYELAAEELEQLTQLTTGKSFEDWRGKGEDPTVLIGGTESETLAARTKARRSQEFLLYGDFTRIDDWVDTTAAAEITTDAGRLHDVWADALSSRDLKTGAAWTTRQMSQAILERGFAQNKARADMLARTGTVWAMNEGAMQRYATAGVTITEWIASLDDVTCPFCLTMHNKVVSVDKSYWPGGTSMSVERGDKIVTLKIPSNVDHPPLHPRCRCTIVPVIRQVRVRVTTPRVPKKTSVQRRTARTRPPKAQKPS